MYQQTYLSFVFLTHMAKKVSDETFASCSFKVIILGTLSIYFIMQMGMNSFWNLCIFPSLFCPFVIKVSNQTRATSSIHAKKMKSEDHNAAATSCRFRKCDSNSCMQYVRVRVWAVTAFSCENNSPGQSVFLLKPICEFTQLIHCDPRADLLLFPSHSPQPLSVS